jgi:PAS domain S-box-containing protein
VEKLRANTDLAAILQGMSDGVTVQGPDGSLVYVNDAAAQLSGYQTAREMLEAPLSAITGRYRLLDEDGQPFPLERLPGRLAIRGEPAPEVLLRVRTLATGEEHWRAVKANPIDDELGHLRYVVNIFRDVTPLKRAESQQRFLAEAGSLLASSLDYRTTLAHLARLAVPVVGDWCAVDMVREGERIQRLAVAHVDPEKVRIANELWERNPPDPDAAIGLPAVLRTGRSELIAEVTDEMLEASVADAEQLEIARALGLRSAMLVPLVARGRVHGAITVVSAESGRRYDQTDLLFAEALAARAALAVENAELYGQLQRELQARDQFFAAASHDLKTPLASIKGTAQLLRRTLSRSGTIDPDRLRSSIDSIDRTTTRMARLVDGLMDVTRLRLGQKVELDRAEVDLARLLREVVAEAQQTTEQHTIRVETEAELVGAWDPARLARAISNLLDNAIKYSPDGGDILVGLTGERSDGEAWALLTVHDRGVGVPADERERIFEPFRRGSNVAGRLSGSGIGLAGARLAVEQHGGSITVAERPGGGTTFTVRLPVASPLAQSVA